MRTLKDDQCSVCGCYCFGSQPHPWEKRETPSGPIQLCCSCQDRYPADGPIKDPAREHRVRRISADLSEAESRAESLREELERIDY